MIHSARPQSRSSEHCFRFVLLDFEKWERTYGRHVQKQLSLPATTVGWPSGSICFFRQK